MSSSAALDLRNPFLTPFTVSNEGYLALYDVEFLCHIGTVQTDDHVEIRSGLGSLRTTHEALVAREMPPSTKNDVPCVFFDLFTAGTVSNADISIVISFKPALVPWRQERLFRFVTVKGSDGNLRWLNKSVAH